MKQLLLFGLVLALILPLKVTADEETTSKCVNSASEDIQFDPDAIQKEISSKTTCYEASKLAEACGLGASGDVATAGYAYDICATELAAAKPSKSNQRLLNTMTKACDRAYRNKEGTMYMASNAYCKLSAIHWILNISADY